MVVSAIGLPVPRSGSFADVYQVKGADGRMWAVKCFTRKVTGLQERYARIDEHLTGAKLPFTVGFKYLAEGIRVRKEWFPLLKMEWVEGFTLNEFVRDNISKPHYLHALMRMWGKLTARLRDAHIAHADLQHGNVLLVPAATPNKLGLKLIDYDGMWVPALADKHSGEIGHPHYQHPLRLKERLFDADVDRFPHLVIACALRATLIGGQELWDKFDNGDNLLFQDADLSDPANAPVFKALWDLKDNVLCALLGELTLATREPLARTPWLDAVLLDTAGPRLSDEQENQVVKMLGVKPHFTSQEVLELPAESGTKEFNDFQFTDDEETRKSVVREILAKINEPEPRERRPARRLWFIGGGVAALALVVGLLAAFSGGKKPPANQTQVRNESPNETPNPDPPGKKDLGQSIPKVDPPKKDPPKELEPEILPLPREVAKTPEIKKPPDVVKKDIPLTRPVVPLKEVWKIADKSLVGGLAFTGDGTALIAAPPGSPNLVIYNAADGKTADTVKPTGAEIESFAVGPGDKIIIRDRNHKPVAWALKKKEQGPAFDANVNAGQPSVLANKAGQLLIGGQQGEIEVRSLVDGAKSESFKVPVAAPIVSVACSPDAKAIVAVAENGEIYRKAPADMVFKLVASVPGAGRRVVAVSPDAKYFAFAFDKQPFRIYETATGKISHDLAGHKAEVIAATFTPDSKLVLSIARDKTLRFWDVESGKPMQEVALPGEGNGLAVSADGRFAATATTGGDGIQLWRLPGFGVRLIAAEIGALLAPPPGPEVEALLKTSDKFSDVLHACHFAPDGKRLFVADKKGSLHVLDAFSLKEIAKPYDIGNGAIWQMGALRRTATTERLYLLNEHLHVRTFDTNLPASKSNDYDMSSFLEVTTNANRYRLATSPDANYLFVVDRDGKKNAIWPLRPNIDPAPEFPPLKELVVIRHIGYTPDGFYGFAAGDKKMVVVWEKKSAVFTQIRGIFEMPNWMEWMAISPEARVIVASDKTKIYAFDYLKNAKAAFEPVEAHGTNNAWMGALIPKTTGLITAGGDNNVRVWDIKTGKEIVKWKIDKPPASIAVSPDGKFAAVGLLGNHQMTLWKLPQIGKKP